MDQHVITGGTYEPEISELLGSLLEPQGVLWDVGANVGVHALTVKSRRPDVTVIAFEPSVAQFVRLMRNATVNDLAVSGYCVALAEQRGYQQFSVVDAGNSGHNSLTPWPDVTYSRTAPVWCDTGCDLVASGVPAPTVMKVDVEGGEAAVLRGLGPVLDEVRHVVFEGPENGPAYQMLASSGFAIKPVASTGGGTDWLASR